VPYLDHAATSLPKPQEVLEAMRSALEIAGNPGRGGHHFAMAAERIVEQARIAVDRLLGGRDPRRVIFTLNGTDALNIAIHAAIEHAAAAGTIPHVVTTTLEHNSVTRPLNALHQAGRIELDAVEGSLSGVLDPAGVDQRVRRDTALVVLTMASNALGTLQPIAEAVPRLRARCGALLLVDAAQVAGAVPLDVRTLGVDLLAAPGHKALLGPMGTGILWVGPGAMPTVDGAGARLGFFRSGGTGGDSRLPTMPEELPHRLEAGTPNVVGIAGLGAGVRWVLDRGVQSIRSHELALVQRAIDGLASIPGVRVVGSLSAADHVGAVTFVMEGLDPLDAATVLDASFGVSLRAGLHCAPGAHRAVGTWPAGAIRLSVGPMTLPQEVEVAVNAVRSLAQGQ